MSKLKNTIWDFAMALIAAGGGLTLIHIGHKFIAGFFILGFAIILFKLGWDIKDAVFPVSLISSKLESMPEAEQAMVLKLTLYFNALEIVRINGQVKMEFDDKAKKAMTDLKIIPPYKWTFIGAYNEPFVTLRPGVDNVVGKYDFRLKDVSVIDKFQTILSDSEIQIGWNRIGKKLIWNKLTSYSHMSVI